MVGDRRPRPEIPAHVCVSALFAMFSARLPSFNELEQQRSKGSWKRWLGGWPLPCADELSYILERLDLESLRLCLWRIHAKLKRNKVLGAQGGWMVAAIDGHELPGSYKRCCPQCLKRRVETKKGDKTLFHHRLVVFQLLGPKFRLLLDVELVRPGEDEVGAALRLLRRVLENHPRCFDVLCADALYLRPSVIELLEKHGKHLVATLKENQPELLDEARRLLFEEQTPVQRFRAEYPDEREVELRSAGGFETETIRTPLRILHSLETKCRAGEQEEEQEKAEPSQWFWATTMPETLCPARFLRRLGHMRWEIENQGFNELVTHWHADHNFHHHPNAIAAIWLVLFMAHAVFHCFYSRNLKAAVRQGHSVIHFARIMFGELLAGEWWPPPRAGPARHPAPTTP